MRSSRTRSHRSIVDYRGSPAGSGENLRTDGLAHGDKTVFEVALIERDTIIPCPGR